MLITLKGLRVKYNKLQIESLEQPEDQQQGSFEGLKNLMFLGMSGLCWETLKIYMQTL